MKKIILKYKSNFRKGYTSLELIFSLVLITIAISICIIPPSKLIERIKFEHVVREFIDDVYNFSVKNLDGDSKYVLYINYNGYKYKTISGKLVKEVNLNPQNMVIQCKRDRVEFRGLYRNTSARIGMKVYFYC